MPESARPLTISILIATYNREDLLQPLFDSIDEAAKEAPEMGVEIVIVDDGSSDGTWSRLEAEKEKRPNLVIHCQKNAGRAAALNQTFIHASGDIGFILDSDDLLTKESLKLVAEAWKTIGNDPAYGGVIGHCLVLEGDKKGQIIGDQFPQSITYSDPEELRVHHKVKGDKKEVLRMQLLKDNLFPLTPGERRVPTSLILNRIGATHKFLLIHGNLIHKTYLEGGMSLTIDKTRAKSARGSRLVYKENLHRRRFKDPRITLRNATNLVRYNLHAGEPMTKDFILAAPFYSSLAGLIMGVLLYRKDLKNYPELKQSKP